MSQHTHRGLFVTFEGVEGCGKSTQAVALAAHLDGAGVPAVLTREPGGTPIGERLRDVLLDHGSAGMRPATELFLYLASRAEHVAHVIAPLLDQGLVVIADRFGDSSVAYQGGGRGLGGRLVESLNDVATNGVKPDVTFLLDLDPGEGLDRLALRPADERGGGRDRIESEALEFHERVRAAYLESVDRDPSRFVVIDGRLARDEITALVIAKVDELLRERQEQRGGQA